jgi:DHA1 family tetracycline resistance protein-like MFS transporter
MSERRPGLGPILLTVFLDLLGFGLVIPLLSFYAETFHATPLQVTALMACYSVAQFLGAPMWGALSDRVGRRPVLLISIAGSAIFLAAFASATSLGGLFLWRTLHGLAAANVSTAQAYVADITEGAERTKGMGLIGAAFGVGFSLGPFIGGQLSPWGLAAPIWLAAALSAINLVWAWFGLPESRRGTEPVAGERRRVAHPSALLRGLRHPVVGSAIGLLFIATFAFAMMESTFALVAEHLWQMGARDVGNLFGMIGGIGIIVQGGLVGRLAARLGERRLVIVGYSLNAAGMAVLGTAAAGWGVWAGCFLLALGSSLATPALNSLISRATSADEQGAVLGVSQSFSALARAVAPGVGGLLYTTWRPGGAMIAGAVLMVMALLGAGQATRKALSTT